MHTSAAEQKTLEEAYRTGYAGFRKDEFFIQTIKDEIANRISQFCAPPAELLDVGCGNGEFLSIAKGMGYHCLGIDISEESRALCERRDLSALAEDFVTYDFGKKFDIVTMWDVMEHLRMPSSFIHKSFKILNQNGVLLLKIPTFGRLNFSILKLFPRRSPVLLSAPDHIQYYSEKSLSTLLGSCGFSEIYWLQNKRFRNARPVGTVKRKIARTVRRLIGELAGNKNAYLIAVKGKLGNPINLKLISKHEILHVETGAIPN